MGILAFAPYQYDGDGNRYSQTVDGQQTDYLLDIVSPLTQVLGESIDNEDDIYYLLGLDVIGQQNMTTDDWSYFGYDGLGSVRTMTDWTGAPVYSADYSPYGETIAEYGDATTNLGFTGEYTDQSGLLYLRARYANPSTASFLTADPVNGVVGQQSVRWNPYLYVGGNPVNWVDPSGEFLLGLLGAAAAGAVIGGGINFLSQVYGNVRSGRPIDEWCIDAGSVLTAAIEGAVMGALGYGFGAIGSLGQFANVSRGAKFIGALATDFAVGMAWDVSVHGDSPSQALVGNLLALGFGTAIEARSWRNAADVDMRARGFDASNMRNVDADGRVRTLRRSDAEAGVSLRQRRAWSADTPNSLRDMSGAGLIDTPTRNGLEVRYDPMHPGGPDPRYSVDTSRFDTNLSTKYTAHGEVLDREQFWRQWADRHPETLSQRNQRLINGETPTGFKSPVVDEDWIQHFPDHANYMRDVLDHHHFNYGAHAIPLPHELHTGSGLTKIWHP